MRAPGRGANPSVCRSHHWRSDGRPRRKLKAASEKPQLIKSVHRAGDPRAEDEPDWAVHEGGGPPFGVHSLPYVRGHLL